MTRNDDQLLQALLDGDAHRDDPEVVRVFASRPDLHKRWNELERLRRELEWSGAEQRAIDSALADVTEADRKLVGAALAGAQRTPRRASRVRPVLAMAAALAVVATVAWWMRHSAPKPDAPQPNFLNSPGQSSELEISGSKSEGLTVRHSVQHATGTYALRIDGLKDGRPDGKLPLKLATLRPEDVRDGAFLQWTISSEQLRPLPDEILVTLEHDEGSLPVRSSVRYSLR